MGLKELKVQIKYHLFISDYWQQLQFYVCGNHIYTCTYKALWTNDIGKKLKLQDKEGDDNDIFVEQIEHSML